MSNSEPDDRLAESQIEKTQAETKKIEAETLDVPIQKKAAFWGDIIKIVGGVIVGIGGIFAAILQSEISDLKVKNLELTSEKRVSQAEERVDLIEKKEKVALKRLDETKKTLVKLREEERDARSNLASFKKSLPNLIDTFQSDAPKPVLVYIQFRGTLKRSLMNQYRAKLSETKEFVAPGVERINSPFENQIKYFDSGSKTKAKSVLKTTEEFFKSKNCTIRMPEPKYVKPEARKNLKHIEVWVNRNCP